MKLISITLSNFRQHAHTHIRFGEGIIGVSGANEGGKTTIVEGIAFALYGTPALRGGKGTVRWNRAPGKRVAQVNLTFEFGGVRYEVMRTESDAKVWADGTPVAATTSAVNAYLERLLGMKWDEFRSSYLVEQKDLNRLKTELKGTARRQFFLEVMGVGVVDDALKRCRDRKNELTHEVDGLAQGLGDRAPLEQAVTEAAAAVTDAESARQQAAVDVEVARNAADAAVQAFEASGQLERQHNEIGHRIAAAQQTRAMAEQEVSAVLQSLTRAREAAARVTAREQELQPLGELRLEREQLLQAKHQQDARRAVSDSIARIESDIAIAEDQIQDAQQQLQFDDPAALAEAETELRQATDRLASATRERESTLAALRANVETYDVECRRNVRRRDAIRAAGRDGACPTCGQALGERFSAVVAELEHDIANLHHQIETAKRQIATLTHPGDDERRLQASIAASTDEVNRLRVYRDDARRAQQFIERETPRLTMLREELERLTRQLDGMGAVPFSPQRLREVEAEIARLVEVERSLADLRAVAARVPEIEEEFERRQQTLRTTRDRVAALEEERATLAFDAGAHAALREAAQRAMAAKEEVERAFARAEAAVTAAQQQHGRAVQALEQYDARAGKLEAKRGELRTHEQTAVRLDDFRRALASSIRPEMEELTSGFVAVLTDGRHESVTIDEDYNVIAQEAGVDVPVVSGGAEDILAIAQRLAVSQMITERAGHPLSLLVLDEPFGSLDAVRRGAVLNLIRRLGGIFQQVLLITHVDEVREAVDHVIEVTYNPAEGRSHVRQIPEPAMEATHNEAAA